MRKWLLVFKREFPATDELSVREVTMLLEDNTGDDSSRIETWAIAFVERTLPGYVVDSMTELA